jgi:hypothetical protein
MRRIAAVLIGLGGVCLTLVLALGVPVLTLELLFGPVHAITAAEHWAIRIYIVCVCLSAPSVIARLVARVWKGYWL